VSTSEQIIPHGHVLRYTLKERLTHWVAAGAYIYLLLTGLAFWSPWLFWIAVILGGAPVSRMLHPWAGLIFFAAVWNMYVMWAPQMKHTDVDKFLFWGFFWGSVALLASGLVLWFPERIPWNLRFLRYISVLIHPAAALFTIGLFLIHIYMGVFAERGAFGSVIRGDVSIAFAKRYHPGWYKEIVGGPSTPPK
jgi:formate dehydrogenase subunit gamma